MKFIQKITTVFLAIVFLLSSLGFTANKMVCLKSGKIKMSLTPVKDCCHEKKSTSPHIKAQCCDLTNTSFHLNDFNSAQKNTIPAAADFILPINKYAITYENCNNHPSKLFFTDLPPPLYGRQLLSFISTLII